MEMLLETWPKRGSGMVLTEDMNRSENGRARDESEPEQKGVWIGESEDGNRVGAVVAVTDCCPSEADANEIAVDIVLWRADIKELNKNELVRYNN